ncbi:hypothetical protein KIL84_009864 [Mauremys mutica]|uniref:Uncharacterized protein n=1 Tax=Mauremys mutica TaxID=74926 RepID=A0A9D3XN26_9SAUR|nr:hypothetical protein KIL84_009864 [Mauremys mutica]
MVINPGVTRGHGHKCTHSGTLPLPMYQCGHKPLSLSPARSNLSSERRKKQPPDPPLSFFPRFQPFSSPSPSQTTQQRPAVGTASGQMWLIETSMGWIHCR